MDLSKLRKLAWVFFALALTTTTVYSQGWRNGNRNFQNQNGNCLSYISGLSEKQQKQILELEKEHQENMTELQDKRRSTIDAIEKNEIRGDMLKKVEAHRNSVKKVLDDEQQKQYDQLHSSGFYGRDQNFANRNGNIQNWGRNSGRQQFTRGNRGGRCYANATNYGRGNGRAYNAGNRNGYRNGNGNGYRAGFNSRGNNFSARRSNFGRGNGNGNMNGNGRFYWQNNGTGSESDGNEAIKKN